MAKKRLDIIVSARDEASKKFGKVGGSARRLSGTLRNLAMAGGAFLSGRALAGFAREAVAEFASFEKQLALVHTMLDEGSSKHLPAYRKEIKRLAAELGQSKETLSKGLYDLLSARVDPKQAVKVLEVATKAAVGGATDTATSVKALVRILRAYDMHAIQATTISDKLFAIVKQGVITYEELAQNIGTVAPSARAAGMSLNELAAAIATMVSVEEPARAMTALRMAIFQAAEAGMDLMSFVRKYKGANLAQIIAAGIPKKAAAGIVILSNNIKLLDENLAAVANSAGAAGAAFTKMADIADMEFKRLRELWKGYQEDIGKGAMKAAEGWRMVIQDEPGARTDLLVELLKYSGNFVMSAELERLGRQNAIMEIRAKWMKENEQKWHDALDEFKELQDELLKHRQTKESGPFDVKHAERYLSILEAMRLKAIEIAKWDQEGGRIRREALENDIKAAKLRVSSHEGMQRHFALIEEQEQARRKGWKEQRQKDQENVVKMTREIKKEIETLQGVDPFKAMIENLRARDMLVEGDLDLKKDIDKLVELKRALETMKAEKAAKEAREQRLKGLAEGGPYALPAVQARFLTRAPGHYNPYKKLHDDNQRLIDLGKRTAKATEETARKTTDADEKPELTVAKF